LPAGEKRAVNQGNFAFGGRNGCVFSEIMRRFAGIDLPQGIGVLE